MAPHSGTAPIPTSPRKLYQSTPTPGRARLDETAKKWPHWESRFHLKHMVGLAPRDVRPADGQGWLRMKLARAARERLVPPSFEECGREREMEWFR